MSRWWRAYDEAVDDPKLQQLPAVLFRAWFNLCCLTSKNGGVLPSKSVIAFKLRCSEEKAAAIVEQLRDVQLIDEIECDGTVDLAPHNWKGRQFQGDTSTPRVKRFREQQRNVSSDVSVTPPETEADTDTEPERKKTDIRAVAVATRPDCEKDFGEFWKVYPKRDGANPKAPAEKLFVSALKSGVSAAEITAGAARYADDERRLGHVGTPHVAQAVTWLRQRRWGDYPATAPPSANPAYLTPPPGCQSLEEIRAMYGNRNAAGVETEVRSDAGMGEDGAGQPAKLRLSG